MKAKGEVSGLAGPTAGHYTPGHMVMDTEGDGSSQKLPKSHLLGSRKKKRTGEQDVFYTRRLVPRVSLLDPDRVLS